MLETEFNNNLSFLGKYFHTVQIDTETYLAYLRKVFLQKGARKLLQVTRVLISQHGSVFKEIKRILVFLLQQVGG